MSPFGFDNTVLLTIHQYATPFLDTLVITTTDLGSPMFVLFIGFLLAMIMLLKKRMYRMSVVLTIIFGAGGFVFIIKHLVERARPQLWADPLVLETGYSFPSGHATLSAALAIAIVAALWYTRWRWVLLVAGAVYVAYVAFTRLYLGVHYPTDIMAGWLVATVWSVVALYAVRLVRNKIAQQKIR